MSTLILTTAYNTNQTFPFVRIPQYGMHAAKTVQLTGAVLNYYSPIVTFDQRIEWERYASKDNNILPIFVNETLNYQEKWTQFHGPKPQNYTWDSHDVIYGDNGDIPYNKSRPDGMDIYLPSWQKFPLVMGTYGPVNSDFLDQPDNSQYINAIQQRKATISKPLLLPEPDDPEVMALLDLWCSFFRDYIDPSEECLEPLSTWVYPVIDNLDTIEVTLSDSYPTNYEVKAAQVVPFYWRTMIKNILPKGSDGIILVVGNSCERSFTYRINGPFVEFVGTGDNHDPKYNQMKEASTMSNLYSYFEEASQYSGLPVANNTCDFSFTVYPSEEMEDRYYTNNPVVFALSAAAFIFLPFLMFVLYDRKVTRQKELILDTAERSDAIIMSLFPSHVHDQLLAMEKDKTGDPNSSGGPIADLYPDTTVLFADIADFTAWSSVRDPNQVFLLLESVYGAFDKCAERRRIFKVETVGDCYVAVCGLPNPRRDHAIAMVKFAKEILGVMAVVTSKLETQLGPGTSTLRMRIGLNSGPTTAGILRGSRGRYQLFGDTVNTAARMESNSAPGRIMCTRKTADLIIVGGKEHWVTPRSDLVGVKGKGTVQCYWCNPIQSDQCSASGYSANSNQLSQEGDDFDHAEVKFVDWLAELFEGMLVDIVAQRDNIQCQEQEEFMPHFQSPRDEVVETIVLPKAAPANECSTAERLDPIVKTQLRTYIGHIVSMYERNPFHNVEHAGHVIMATKKLLSRVIKPKESSASDNAYGITSDPLTQFAIVFAALIHDVDHPGVSNAQLVKENLDVAKRYKNKSVAEQNSITISWDLLFRAEFTDLRNAIMPTESECIRFRQLIVNSVMATDLFDGDLKSLRETRWSKAFSTSSKEQELSTYEAIVEDSNRRATIVIEHIIQAADVSHTMQHWHVYQNWNRKLFQEMHIAYVAGRSEKDPALGWYEGELWFFDNYIIPLAKKLKTCGVFGVSCDELLDYAVDNRAEWAAKGKDIVAANIELCKSMSLNSARNIVGSELGRIGQIKWD